MSLPRVLFLSNGWPCGLHDVGSHARRLGLAEVRIVRCDDPASGLLEKIVRKFTPHIVGLRVEGGRLDHVRQTMGRVREIRPETLVVLGGPTATSHPAELLETTGADFAFAGEAEESFARFLERFRLERHRLETGDAGIPGLVSRKNNSVTKMPYHDCERVLISETILRENRLDWSLLEGFAEGKALDSIYLVGGRGCPGRCTFCTRLHGQKLRTKTVDQLLEEIRGADRLVNEGRLPVSRWPLFEYVDDPRVPDLPRLSVRWLSIFDEDFFLDRARAIEFFKRFALMPQARRYRLGFQTNPVSLLRNGRPDAELFAWFDRLKPMIQLGGESFHPGMLRRWKKRHDPIRLERILDALDATRQDYTLFHIQADYETTPSELRESTRLLLGAARRHPAMRIASSPLMIPLYDTDIRRNLPENLAAKLSTFTDYERPHPEWLAPDLAALLDRLDEQMQHLLYPPCRDAALEAIETILAETQDEYNG